MVAAGCRLAVSRGKTLPALNSKANEQVLTARQRVVGAALRGWLDENKADVLEPMRAAVALPGIFNVKTGTDDSDPAPAPP